MVTKKVLGAFLVVVFLASSIYFMMPDKVRIDIEKTRTKYSVWENDWVLAATEYVNLYDGSTKMRAKSRGLNYSEDSDYSYVTRTSTWKENITTIQTYTFYKAAENVEDFPIGNEFECLNCEGKIVHYEIRDILYENPTEEISSPFSFGHNMKIEWGPGAYYSKVFQQKSVDKIIIKYRPQSSHETYKVRLYDPVLTSNITMEAGVQYNITVNHTANYSCIDIDHPSYGDRYACGKPPFDTPFNISYFRGNEFVYQGATVTSANLTFTNHSYCSDGVSCANTSLGVMFSDSERVNVNVDIPGGEEISSLSFHQYLHASNTSNTTLKICKDTDSNRICDGGNGSYDAQCSMVVSATTSGWQTCQLNSTITTVAGDYILYFLQNNSAGIFVSRALVNNSKTYYQTNETQPYGTIWGDVLLRANGGDVTNETIYISSHQYDNLVDFKLNLTGTLTRGTVPKEVKIYVNGTLSNYVGALFEGSGRGTETFSDGTSFQNLTYSVSGSQTIYVKIPKNANVSSATVDIEGFENEYVMKGTSGNHDMDWGIFGMYASTYWIQQRFKPEDTLYALTYFVWPTGTRNLQMDNGTIIEDFSGESTSKVYLTTPYEPSVGEILKVYMYDPDHDPSTAKTYYGQAASTWFEAPTSSDGLDPSQPATIPFGALMMNLYGMIFPTDPFMEVGSVDGTREWEVSGEFNVTNTTDDFSDEINTFLISCEEDDDGYCSIPIYVSSLSAGYLYLDALNISYSTDLNPISVDVNIMQAFLGNNSETASIPVTIENQANGTVTISDLRYDYLGGNYSAQADIYDTYKLVNSIEEDFFNTTGSVNFSGSENKTRHFLVMLEEQISSALMTLVGDYIPGAVNYSESAIVYEVSSYSCVPNLAWDWNPDCEYAVDGNVSSYAHAKGDWNIHENYDKPSWAASEGVPPANYTFKYAVLCDTTPIYLWYWNYGYDQWSSLLSTTEDTNASYTQEVALSPYALRDDSGVVQGPIKILHLLEEDCINYYEGGVRWFNQTPQYPTDPWIEIGTPDGTHEWNYSGTFSTSNRTNNMSSAVSAALNSGACDCTGCSITNETHVNFTDAENYNVTNDDDETGWLYVNYTDSSEAVSAKWNIHNNCSGNHNITIPSGCRDGNTIQLQWESNLDIPGTATATGSAKCYNYTSSSWATLSTCSGTVSTSSGGCTYGGNMYDGNITTYAAWAEGCAAGLGWKASFDNPKHALYEELGVYYELNQMYCKIPVTFHSDSIGEIDYNSISIIGNLTKKNTVTRYLVNYYSSFIKALPYAWADYVFFLPKTNSSKNVTPYGQKIAVPIYDITTTNYGGQNLNLSIRVNETFSCMDLSWNATGSGKPADQIINTTWQLLKGGLEYKNNTQVWLWADLDNCNPADQRSLKPELQLESYCEDCSQEGQ